MPRTVAERRRTDAAPLPQWVAPQLTQLVDAAPEGDAWLHEIKFDGYRMHARLDRGAVKLLTRTGLDWTHKYPPIAAAVASLGAQRAYLDGELRGTFPGGVTSFSMIQAASDAGNAAGLVYFIFDLLHLDGEDIAALPLIERKARLAELLAGAGPPLHYSDYHRGGARPSTRRPASWSSRASSRNGPMPPTRPATAASGSRSNAFTARNLSSSAGPTRRDGGRTSARCCSPITIRTESWSMPAAPAPASTPPSSERLWRRLQPLAIEKIPLDIPPPRGSRFGSPLRLSRVHWVRPELVAEVKFLTWTDDNLLRQVVYEGLREDKPAIEVRRDVPRPKPG